MQLVLTRDLTVSAVNFVVKLMVDFLLINLL